jgi:hypothetical protein
MAGSALIFKAGSGYAQSPCGSETLAISSYFQNDMALLQGWRIEMEDAHSAIIGIPDQKESGTP